MDSLREWQRGALHTWVQRYGFKKLWSERRARLHVLFTRPVGSDFVSPAQVYSLWGEDEKQVSNNWKVFSTEAACSQTSCQSFTWKSEIVFMDISPIPHVLFSLPCHYVCWASLLLWQAQVREGWGGWRAVRRWTQPHLKYGPRGSARASLPSGAGCGAGWGSPRTSLPEEKWGHQRQKFASITTEAELQGTTLKTREKEQPLGHSVLASLWRRADCLCDVDICPLGAGLWQSLISCRALIHHSQEELPITADLSCIWAGKQESTLHPFPDSNLNPLVQTEPSCPHGLWSS